MTPFPQKACTLRGIWGQGPVMKSEEEELMVIAPAVVAPELVAASHHRVGTGFCTYYDVKMDRHKNHKRAGL